ncbi:hypothetical protein ABFY67_00910 [Pseudomonas aeruginosa]|uniref:hypothetical protein n=1 Tax=Pseudomonas aeruginosa TaxID=287 RepID=UPI003D28D698
MTRLEVLLAELYTDHGIDLIRTTAGMSKEVEEKITELAEELVKLLQGRRLPLKNVKEVNAILDEAAKAIKAQYTEIAAAHDANLRQLAVIEGGFASNSVNSLVSRPIMLGVGKNRLSAVVANTLIEGAPTKQWWLKQAADVSFRFAGVVRNGFVNGETTEQMVTQIVGRRARGDQPPVKGFMDVSKRAARTLVHNSAQAVANGARMEVYKGQFWREWTGERVSPAQHLGLAHHGNLHGLRPEDMGSAVQACGALVAVQARLPAALGVSQYHSALAQDDA